MNVYEKLADPLAFVVFIATLFLPVVIGLISMRKTKDQSDFFVGGRAMSRVVVALSAVSSGRSSWLVLGLSGIAYTKGMGAIWAIVGYITVEALQFVTLGKKLRRDTQKMGSITLLDYFESRFSDKFHIVRLCGSLIIAIFITAYVSAQFNAGAKTLSSALDLNFGLCLIISAALILVYMVLGGYVAVAYNDVVRALIMLVGLLVLPTWGILKLGGINVLFQTVGQLNPDNIDPFSLGAGAIIGFLGIGLGSPGQPHIVVRYMSIDDPKNLRLAAIIGTFWNIILGLGAIFIGLLGRSTVPNVADLPENDPELIYLVLSSNTFGPILYGLLVGGVFAAILSTADSQLLVVASTFVRDVYEKTILAFLGKGDPSEKTKLLLSRLVVIFSGIIALGLAFIADELVFWLVLFAWGGLGASLGPALILSLYWKGTSKYGVIASMFTGTTVTIIWKLWLKEPTKIYELIPAFFASLFVLVVVSLVTRGGEKNKST